MTTFMPREKDESLARHLFRNADAIGASRDQVTRLRRAAVLAMGGRYERIEAGRIAAEVRDELKGNLAEAVMVAQAKGETILPFNDDGAVRIKGRDGLWSAQDAGMITMGQCQIGLEYRRLWELVSASPLGSQFGRMSETRVAASSTDGTVLRGLHLAYAGMRLTAAEAAVIERDPGQRGLTVLRAVAGEGRTIRSLAASGHQNAVLRAKLGEALDLAGRSFVQTEGLRITGR
ncbi:hypothetical protein [Brevundimonas subvibrioides]|uniref:Uncharacterized protein n=1 Tax=Brevundimonas subvibrioides (strain ATCC 15264 / DSM 4735 / LMG 14903 / NBRC 16000 / CB 81) TaxID=633149 RepID=D9QI97_BRESC|nr:hypothetical protein [Brevundimonas subvibrioides]ADK99399.1 hypothetical protein Bresu_0085 [Brevundimonas subvibrioides ATCC 15264]